MPFPLLYLCLCGFYRRARGQNVIAAFFQFVANTTRPCLFVLFYARQMEQNPTASRLNNAAIPGLSATLGAAPYDREALSPSIVHIGVGGFHRAHLATYVDELCRAGHTDWAIFGTGVMPGDKAMADALHPQDCLFTVVERGASMSTATVIGSMIEYLHADPDRSGLVDAIAAPTTQIVSLTVTEGGYPIDDATGDFDASSPNASDTSAFAAIAAGLEKRMADGGAPLTIMSCDNIMANGNATRAATLGLVEQVSAELVQWVQENVSFPNSMVDRITPATADADREWLTENYAVEDAWPVVCEPFRQWVIEDSFAGARLPLEELDVIVTDDVTPYEHMKLQLLNAGHSCLAYAAALLDIEFVHEAMADEDVRLFVRSFLDNEAKTSLAPVPGLDVDDYIATLIDRFSNPQIRDQVSRLCQDGSGKLPKFLLPTMRTQLHKDGPLELGSLLLATWCQYLIGTSDSGQSIDVAPDPLLDIATAAAKASVDDPAAFLAFEQVFDSELSGNDAFTAAFTAALETLRENGVRSAIRQVSGSSSAANGGTVE